MKSIARLLGIGLIVSLGAAALVTTSACSNKTDKLLPMPDYSKLLGKQKQDLGEYVPFNPQVDILFVIDDSFSMDVHQANLVKNLDFFIDGFGKNKILDWHVGVVDSTVTRGAGELRGNPKFVEKTTPNFKNVLKRNLIVGTGGDSTEV